MTSYQSMVNGAYNDYWQLRNLAFADPNVYSITDLGTRAIGAQLIAAGVLAAGTDLTAPSAETLAAIQAAATKRFQQDQYLLGNQDRRGPRRVARYVVRHRGRPDQPVPGGGRDDGADLGFGDVRSAFSYVLPTNSTLYANLNSGSQWSLDQLRYTVSAGANPANGVPPPSIASLPLNISGRQVMLYAPNGSIGSLASPESFSFTSTDASQSRARRKRRCCPRPARDN